jgi:hypothetical protein
MGKSKSRAMPGTRSRYRNPIARYVQALITAKQYHTVCSSTSSFRAVLNTKIRLSILEGWVAQGTRSRYRDPIAQPVQALVNVDQEDEQ